MLKRFYDALLNLLLPFHAIAKELTVIRELYELDLANREKPIYRITESPGKDDTEVTYVDEEKKRTKADELVDAWTNEE